MSAADVPAGVREASGDVLLEDVGKCQHRSGWGRFLDRLASVVTGVKRAEV